MTVEELMDLPLTTRVFTEAEVIERERAAFFNGAVYGEMTVYTHPDTADFPRKAHDMAAQRYPLPKQVPA